jgi:hypothetical protein
VAPSVSLARWVALLLLPAVSVLLGATLDAAARPVGLDQSTASTLAVLFVGSTLVVVPVLAFRWSRSIPKAIGASAAAFLVVAPIVFAVIVVFLASVGET